MKSLFRIFDIIGARLIYPFLFVFLSVQSLLNGLKARSHSPRIHWEENHEDQPIALVALYQKGTPRPDTLNLLRSLKKAGVYTIAVNTLKLDPVDALREYCDCYIEKFNFGRDFGSYKLGFDHFFSRKLDQNCPRLMIINDSVFCASDRIDQFVEDMINTDAEVLGSTENYEIIHHLGSFCISFSQSVLQHPKFREFWRKYRNSDVRPRVIHEGEQKLSKTLRRCASAPAKFRTLYGTNTFLNRLRDEDDLLDVAIKNARNSPLTGWKRFSAQKVVDELREKYILRVTDMPERASFRLDDAFVRNRVAVGDFAGILEMAKADLREGETLNEDYVRRMVISHLTESYMSGSQIHQNASTLLTMGLPIIKLDGLYRGMFTIEDMQLIVRQLPEADGRALQTILLERPYGGDALRGWRRAAFMRGLI